MTKKQIEKVKTLVVKGLTDPVKLADELFFVGYQLDQRGQTQEADVVYSEARELLEMLSTENGTRVSSLALARCAREHGMRLIQLGRFEQARCALQEAVRQYERMLKQNVSAAFINQFATVLRLLAKVHHKLRDFDRAITIYQRAIVLIRGLLLVAHSREEQLFHQRNLGLTLIGYGKTLEQTDKASSAKAYFNAAKELLEGTSRGKQFSLSSCLVD